MRVLDLKSGGRASEGTFIFNTFSKQLCTLQNYDPAAATSATSATSADDEAGWTRRCCRTLTRMIRRMGHLPMKRVVRAL